MDQHDADKQYDDRLELVAQHAERFMINVINKKALVLQGLHLPESKHYSTLARVAGGAINSWTLLPVSGTNNSKKKTMKSYGAWVDTNCAIGELPTRNQANGVVVPIYRHVAVTFLPDETGGVRATHLRRPIEAAIMGRTATIHPPARRPPTIPQARAADGDGMEAGGTGSSDDDPTSDKDKAEAIVAEVLAAAGTSTATPTSACESGTGEERRGATTQAARPQEPPRATRMPSATNSRPGTGAEALPMSTAPRNVGQSVIRMHQSSLAKAAAVITKLFTGCPCAPCAVFHVESYDSVGCYEPANRFLSQSKTQRFLEGNAAGVVKAADKRDPALPDSQRHMLTETLMLHA